MIVLRLVGVLIDLLLLPVRLALRARRVPEGAWVTVTIDGPVIDVVGKPRFWQLRRQRALSLHALDEAAAALAVDPRVRGLVVTLRSMRAGMATASSLRAILERVRSSGKEVVVHLPVGGDTKDVLVATAGTKILLGPRAQLAPLGFRVASRYLKNALDRAGIEPQVFACGEFKSAGETLVRDGMSPEQRAQLERLLEAFHAALVDAIARGRLISPERAAELVDGAPYFGAAAVEHGLADGLAYEDEVPEQLGVPEEARRAGRWSIDLDAYLALKRRPLLRRVTRRPIVAVLPVHGAITHAGGLFGELSTDERVIRMVRAVRRDRRALGVILHVDSPGGSALASDRMHREIELLAREKPVVACMANVAASGGYYVAAPAACIVASPTTVTGSIGVVAARLSAEPLLSRLGVRTDVVEKGRRAALLSPAGPIDDDARGAIQRELDATYRAFVAVVADGREMTEADVERVARGRIYTGADAQGAGLVDVLGGFDVALAELKQRLDARARDRVEVRLLRPPRQPLPPPPPKPEDRPRAVLAALLPAHERAVVDLVASGERVLALAPVFET